MRRGWTSQALIGRRKEKRKRRYPPSTLDVRGGCAVISRKEKSSQERVVPE